jgi:hypothetical protein
MCFKSPLLPEKPREPVTFTSDPIPIEINPYISEAFPRICKSDPNWQDGNPYWHLDRNFCWHLVSGFNPDTHIYTEARTFPSMDNISTDTINKLQKLDINYRLEGTSAIIINPECEEYEDYTAYMDCTLDEIRENQTFKSNGTYHSRTLIKKGLQNKLTKKVPTKKMISMAEKYYDNALEALRFHDVCLERKKFDDEFNKKSLDGISYCWRQDFETYSLLPDKMAPKYLTFMVDDIPECFKDYIVILKKAIKRSKKSITITISKFWVTAVVGKDHKNIEKLAELLGLEHIKVFPSKD